MPVEVGVPAVAVEMPAVITTAAAAVPDLALPAATVTTSTARAIGPETAVVEAMPARDATTRWLPLHPHRHHRSMPQPQGHQRTKVSLL
jgi:hypothetical protein